MKNSIQPHEDNLINHLQIDHLIKICLLIRNLNLLHKINFIKQLILVLKLTHSMQLIN